MKANCMQTLSGNAENWSRVVVLLPMILDKSEKLHAHCRKRSKHKSEIRKMSLSFKKTIEMSVFVVRVFVQLRDLLSTHKRLAVKLDELENKILSHDKDISMLINSIRQLMTPPVRKKRQIGFLSKMNGE